MHEKTYRGHLVNYTDSIYWSGTGIGWRDFRRKNCQKLANPNTPLASLNFKLQYRTYEGDLPNADDQDSTTLLFQPSLPFPLAK